MINYNERMNNGYKYNWFIGIIYFALFFLCAFLLIATVSALSIDDNSTIVVSNTTESSITWLIMYNSTNRPYNATLDGVEIIGFNARHDIAYTASELSEKTTHTFCLDDGVKLNCDSGTTTSKQDIVSTFLSSYLFAMIGILCVGISAYFKIQEFSMVGFLISFVGYLLLGSSPTSLESLIYMFIMIASIGYTFMERE